MTRKAVIFACFLALFGITALLPNVSPVWGQEKTEEEDFSAIDFTEKGQAALTKEIKAANDTCENCHASEDLVNPSDEAKAIQHLLGKAIISKDAFKRSDHTGMGCVECHINNVTTYPHKKDGEVAAKACLKCHPETAKNAENEFAQSIHAKNHKADFNCQSCHDVHVYKAAKNIPTITEVLAQDNQMCITCHEDPVIYGKIKPVEKLGKVADLHTWLPNPEQHFSAVRCIDCHSPKGTTLSHKILGKDEVLRNCEACHSADSDLGLRTYRHVKNKEEITDQGVMFPYIWEQGYVVGTTRNVWIDKLGLYAILVVVAFLAGHGLIRFIGQSRRNGDQE